MLPPPAERPKLGSLLAQLGAAVEELLLSGLTTASDATRQTLAATMQEAARFRLLRVRNRGGGNRNGDRQAEKPGHLTPSQFRGAGRPPSRSLFLGRTLIAAMCRGNPDEGRKGAA